jgi:hypothetical protein
VFTWWDLLAAMCIGINVMSIGLGFALKKPISAAMGTALLIVLTVSIVTRHT